MAHIDITDKIGFALLKKGVIDYETLEKSLRVKESEEKKNRRNLGQILVNDFNADHDAVFREVADLYAFREISIVDEKIEGPRLEFIKKFVDGLPQNVREMLIQTKMLPLKYDEKQPDKLIIVAADPTDRRIPLVARSFGGKKYEVAYCRLYSRRRTNFSRTWSAPRQGSRSKKKTMSRSTKKRWKLKSPRAPSSTLSRARSWKPCGREQATSTSSPRKGTGRSSGSGWTAP
jgi:hypothetical protein